MEEECNRTLFVPHAGTCGARRPIVTDCLAVMGFHLALSAETAGIMQTTTVISLAPIATIAGEIMGTEASCWAVGPAAPSAEP